MADGRGSGGSSGGRGGDQPFYNQTLSVGGSDITWATIIAGGLAFLLLSGSTLLSGLFSVLGLTLVLVVGTIWIAWKISRDGIWKMGSSLLAFVIAIMVVKEGVMVRLPQMIYGADMSEWNKVLVMVETGVQSNSPLINQPMQGVTIPDFNTPPQVSYSTPTQVDPNVGGGVPNQTGSVDNVVTYVEPTPNPTAELERQLNMALLNGEGNKVIEITGQILTINPNHVNAMIANEQAITEKIHADNLANMPQPTGAFMQGVNDINLNRAKDLLGSNGEMSGGYMYMILDNGASTTSMGCNELATLRLDTGLFAGKTFTTQRCLISSIAGGSDNNKVFTVR